MKRIIYFTLCLLLLASCGETKKFTRSENYPKMYEEKPTCILIMPPINKTVNVEAKEYFYTSLAMPLCEKGYYTISPFLAMEMFKSESAYDSEMFIEGSLSKFREVFGADAALFTIINRWEKSTLGNTITVDIEYFLKSTTNNEILFNRKGTLTVDLSINSGSGGLLGALVDMAASAIATASTDKVVAARRCNTFSLFDLPDGKYRNTFGTDQNTPASGKEFKATVKK
ncbi:GNA1162 family protein [Bacteroides sedimenti]